MRFSITLLTAATFVTAAFATFENPISHPDAASSLVAGESFEIKWNPTTEGPITLLLKAGPSGNLNTLATIVQNAPNTGSFLWTPAASLPAGTDYAIEIRAKDGTEVNYTPQFGVKSTAAVSASAVLSVESTTTATLAPFSSADETHSTHATTETHSTSEAHSVLTVATTSSGMTTSTKATIPLPSANATAFKNSTSPSVTLPPTADGAAAGLVVKGGLMVVAAALAVVMAL